MTIEEKAKVYYQHMVNAYREPDDRVDPGIVLELKKGMDMTEELAAMMMAMMSILTGWKADWESHTKISSASRIC